jgi:hypothetical protein
MKIALVNVYFGKWPIWFPAFLQSCKFNSSINWLLFTDCAALQVPLENVTIIPTTVAEFNALASRTLGFEVQLPFPYKLCDYRTAYGVIFEDYLQAFDFWGHCDIDIIWGDIRSFISESILRDNQIISSRWNTLAGHFTLWKNEAQINTLFRQVPNYKAIIADPASRNFDETIMSDFLKTTLLTETNEPCKHIKVYWPKHQVAGGKILDELSKGWYWQNGKILNQNGQEYMYLHFISWKNTLVKIDFQPQENPLTFKITHRGIWAQKPPLIEQFLETTQLYMLLTQLYRWFKVLRKTVSRNFRYT